MDSVAVLLEVLTQDPGDDAAWFALADALEEQDDAAPRSRAEATRLSVLLRRQLDDPAHPQWETRLRQLVEANVRVVLPRQRVRLAAGVELEMVLVPPGSFRMGSLEYELERQNDETPHRVVLTKGFWVGVTSVTQAQWSAVMGSNPSRFPGRDRPAEMLSWFACQDFCGRLSERTGRRFRLPTEAEWEYACRAGTTTPFFFGGTISPDRANYDCSYSYGGGTTGIFREEPVAVGCFPANPWGLADMHGNVYDWCQDWYETYPTGPITDQQGSQDGVDRVLRGGSWYSYPRRCRSAFRHHYAPDNFDDIFGCRVVQSLE